MISEENILSAKILAVDDNILNLQIIKKILATSGFINVTVTTDPTSVLGAYEDIAPDLLLLDLSMPVMDGFEIMKLLRMQNPNDYLPILVVSAEDEHARLKALSCGAKDFLHKPYQSTEVVLRSRNIIEVRLLYKQLKTQNTNLESQVEERTNEIKQTRLDVIRRLANAAELKDTDTGHHIIRMSYYSEKIALAMGFSPAQAEMVLNAAPLHDIGKIAIPDAVLLKPGKLEPQEFEVIKAHTTIGAKILSGSNSPFLKMAEIIALTHHERFDGKGYPRGLKGEDIPLVGQICSVADVFDALVSVRPYKKAWSFDEAVVEIKNSSEKNFNPKVVEAFIEAQNEIRSIYEKYRDA